MKICIVGDGLVSLTLAKALVNKGIKIDIFSSKKLKKLINFEQSGSRVKNIEFFNKDILNIKKIVMVY